MTPDRRDHSPSQGAIICTNRMMAAMVSTYRRNASNVNGSLSIVDPLETKWAA